MLMDSSTNLQTLSANSISKPAVAPNSFQNFLSTPSSTLLDPATIGKIGMGIGHQSLIIKDSLYKHHKEPSKKAPLLKFFPVVESQLVKDSIVFTAYSKTSVAQSKDLLYRLYKTEGKLVRSILELSNFTYTDAHDWNLLWLGCIPQPYLYEGLNQYQRINHFPNSYELTRKDRMSFHLRNMLEKFGEDHYGFFPETYTIPEEFSEFSARYLSDKTKQWIVKPCNSSQGKGIFILDCLNSLPTFEGCVVSRYISNPLLLNGLKFDLRIYVLVTSYQPMRIYIYDEGLARFASEAYNPSSKASKFSILTNYSINKKNDKFVQNSDWKHDNIGHKWSLSALLKALEEMSVNTDEIIAKIYDLVIKSVIAIEPVVVNGAKKLGLGKNNCFDLFGFDVLIDSNLKPWLLEVNLSPSLATDSPLDLYIKSNLIADTLNLVGVRVYDRKKEIMSRFRARIRARKHQLKQSEGLRRSLKAEPIDLAKHKASINDLIEESSRLGNFIRIFPSQDSQIYEKFFVSPRACNKALYLFLISQPSLDKKDPETFKDLEKEKALGDKLVITGDDILIEYLSRVLHACKSVSLEKLKNDWKSALEKFVNHYVWLNFSALFTSLNVLQKVEFRISEIRERQKHSEGGKKDLATQKHGVVRGFSALQLENMLKSSNKCLAKEVTSCLFLENCGILSRIIKWLARSSMKGKKKVFRNESLTNENFLKVKGKKSAESCLRSGSFVIKALKARTRPKTVQDDMSDDLE